MQFWCLFVPLTLDRPYDSLLATFQSSRETPYAEDDSILPRKRVLDELGEIEDRYAALMSNVVQREAWGLLNKTKAAIKAHDLKAIQKTKTTTANAINPLLYSLWRDGWALGWRHAQEELKILERGEFSLSTEIENFVTFAEQKKKRKPPIRRAKFPKPGEPVKLEDAAMKAAIEQRTIRVAQDLDDTTRQEIQQHLSAAADPDNPISGKELERRIESSIGKQQFKRSDVPAKDVQKEYRRGGFKRRAQIIATTELMGAYSLAKLSALKAAGVRRVRWQTFEPPDGNICETCWSRNGTIHYIDDLLGVQNRLITLQYNPARPSDRGYDPRQYLIPAHPNCRCTWVGVPDEFPEDPGRNPRNRNPFPLKGLWASVLTGAIGIGALYLVLGRMQLGRALGRAINTRRAGLIGETAVDVAEGISELPERGPQDQPGRVRPTFVGDIDINRASTNLLKTRFNLDDEQASALRKSLIDNPIDDINDLARRIERGEIPGLTPELFEANILSTQPLPPVDMTVRLGSLLDSAAIASGGAMEGQFLEMVKESLRGMQISPRVAEEIYREFYTSEQFFSTADELRVRLGNRGVQISDREMEIIRQNFVFTPSTINWDSLKRSTPSPGAGAGETPDVLAGPQPGVAANPPRDAAGVGSDLIRAEDGTEALVRPGATTTDRRRAMSGIHRRVRERIAETFPDMAEPFNPNLEQEELMGLLRDQRLARGRINEIRQRTTEIENRIYAIQSSPGSFGEVRTLRDELEEIARERTSLEGQLVQIQGQVRPYPKEVSEAFQSIRLSTGRIYDYMGRIDILTQVGRSHIAALERYGYEVRFRRDPVTGNAVGFQLVEPDGPIELNPYQRRRKVRAEQNLVENFNARRQLYDRLTEEQLELSRQDVFLRNELARYQRQVEPQTIDVPAVEVEPPPRAPEAPPEPPVEPTVGGPPGIDPVEAAINAEENAWALARDELIASGQYNSSAREYQSFNAEVINAGRRRMNEWKVIRRGEKIQGSKIRFAKEQFPRMSKLDYQEAARNLDDIEKALDNANAQEFVQAYSRALMAPGRNGSRLTETYPEFAQFLEQRYPSQPTLNRIARHFGVIGRTPYYNPRYFSDEAGTRWFDVGREIEDEWRRNYRQQRGGNFQFPRKSKIVEFNRPWRRWRRRYG